MLTVEAGTLDVVVIYIKKLSYFCCEALHDTTSPQSSSWVNLSMN